MKSKNWIFEKIWGPKRDIMRDNRSDSKLEVKHKKKYTYTEQAIWVGKHVHRDILSTSTKHFAANYLARSGVERHLWKY